MVRILLCNGKEYSIGVGINEVIGALERSNECDNPFVFIEQDGVKRLIRIDMIEEVVDTEEFSSNSISATVNVDIDVEKLSARIMEMLDNKIINQDLYTKQALKARRRQRARYDR